jgi:hypothetical protein
MKDFGKMDSEKCLECFPGNFCGYKHLMRRKIKTVDMECPCYTCLVKVMCKGSSCILYKKFDAYMQSIPEARRYSMYGDYDDI